MEGEIKKVEEKLKERIEEVEERLAALENFINTIYEKLQKISQEERFRKIEEKISDLEDLQMLNRLEIIKVREILRKTPLGGLTGTFETRIDFIESSVNRLKRDVETEFSGLSSTLESVNKRIDEMEARVSNLENRIAALKTEFEKFAERSVKIMKKVVRYG